jgi:tRNA-splicing ligase RtcB
MTSQDALERLRRAEDVARVAVMPDVHLAEDVCIGTVLATHAPPSLPAAVGGDIGCGMAAIASTPTRTSSRGQRRRAAVLDGPHARRSRRCQRWPDRQPLPDGLASARCRPRARGLRRRSAGLQLGTLGRGNHFVELQADDAGACG